MTTDCTSLSGTQWQVTGDLDALAGQAVAEVAGALQAARLRL
jgi:hypothetical protein